MFVKAVATKENRHVSGKNFNPLLSEVKMKKFIPICHYCSMSSHIRPRCFKYKNTFMINRMENLITNQELLPNTK